MTEAKHILDADVVIRFLRAIPSAVILLETLGRSHRLAISTITLVEVYAGMRREEEDRTERFLRGLEPLVVDNSVARKAGEYLGRFASHGVSPPAAIVAATSTLYHLEVVTYNSRHYPMSDVRLHRTSQ